MKKNNTPQRGFIALISAVIISAILLTLATGASSSAFFSRFSALNSEYKRVSLGLAESCVNSALLQIAQNYNTTALNAPVSVGANTCTIKSIGYVQCPQPGCTSPNKRIFTIKAQAQYKGAFSNIQIAATAQDPAQAPAVLAPTCSFTLSPQPASITQGQSVTLQWATAGSATSISVVRNMGGTNTTIYSGSITGTPLTNTPSQSATYTATITGPGGSTQCVSPQQVTVNTSVSCAETVVILTGGMSSNDRTNEGAAAKTLLNLYAPVIPTPHVGVGSFGGLDGSAAQVPTGGQLTGTYGSAGAGTGLYGVINQIVSTVNSSGGTNVSAGINVAKTELDGPRHQPGFQRVLIFVSDGKPIDPGSANQAEAAALASSDAAKQDGINVFSVHFGSNSGRDLVAELAGGAYQYTGHQSGSNNEAGNSNNQSVIDLENSDDDNFFIAPTSADMATIFSTIGKKVCPTAIPPAAPTPPPAAPTPSLPPNITIGSWQEVPTTP